MRYDDDSEEMWIEKQFDSYAADAKSYHEDMLDDIHLAAKDGDYKLFRQLYITECEAEAEQAAYDLYVDYEDHAHCYIY